MAINDRVKVSVQENKGTRILFEFKLHPDTQLRWISNVSSPRHNFGLLSRSIMVDKDKNPIRIQTAPRYQLILE